MDLSNVLGMELVKEIYGDLAKPGVSQVGKALGTIFSVVNVPLHSLHSWSEKKRLITEQNLESFREKISHVPLEQVIEAAPEIGVPIIEKLTYVENEDLSELYQRVLLSATDLRRNANAHPSFINVINNLSPDEAKLIGKLQDEILCVEPRAVNANGYKLFAREFLTECSTDGLFFPNNESAYFRNLEGLGLLRIHFDIYRQDEVQYKSLENRAQALFAEELNQTNQSNLTLAVHIKQNPDSFAHAIHAGGFVDAPQLIERLQTTRKLECQKGLVVLTSFGKLFIKAVISP